MPPRITVVGLGPGDPALRTVGAQAALDRARRIVLRTRVHPGLADLTDDPRAVDCDDLYESGATFDGVYAAVVERVLAASRDTAPEEVVFAVPGHPRFGERSVPLLIERAAGEGVSVEVQSGVSALDALATALGIDPMTDEVQLVDAFQLGAAIERDPFAAGLVAIDPARGCLVGQVFSAAVAAGVKLALSRVYPDEHPIVVVRAAGVPDAERLIPCRLFELDRHPLDHLSSVWVPALAPLAALRSLPALPRIVALLRAPGGCPWDRTQTHASLRSALIEETYEAVDAIDADDPDNLAEELGDLLLQVTMHAQIAEEAGTFALEDVAERVSRKMLRRHPHIFADETAGTPEDVITTWEAVKAAERAKAGAPPRSADPLDRLPRAMPVMTRAASLSAARKGSRPPIPTAEQEAAVGDALLGWIERAVARGVDPERALGAALRRRFVADETAPVGSQTREGRATA